jgi:outer membrane protein assembly factor BamB
VYAYNATSGAQVWKASGILAAQAEWVGDPQLALDPCGGTDTIHAFSSTSLAAALGSGTLVVTATDGIQILSLATGSQVWTGQVAGIVGPLKNPVILGKTLYAIDTGANGGLGGLVTMTSP